MGKGRIAKGPIILPPALKVNQKHMSGSK